RWEIERHDGTDAHLTGRLLRKPSAVIHLDSPFKTLVRPVRSRRGLPEKIADRRPDVVGVLPSDDVDFVILHLLRCSRRNAVVYPPIAELGIDLFELLNEGRRVRSGPAHGKSRTTDM